MKKYLFAVSFLFSITTFSQEIIGHWFGVLKIQNTELHLVFNISKTNNGDLGATMDSRDQHVIGIPVSTIAFDQNNLKIAIANAGISYNGVLKGNEIIGNFEQAGQVFSMNLTSKEPLKDQVIRSQEPIKPYEYISENIVFENRKAKIKIAGTLTFPKNGKNFPVVILISGSGAQNRDEELLGHKPFLVLSDYLTKNGIAVLRCDDRGTGESEGNFSTATTLDFAGDVSTAVQYLQSRKEFNQNKIGLIGHSEGGIIAPMVASENKSISFIVMLAGTGIPGDKLMLLQKETIERQMGVDEKSIKKGQELLGGVYDLIQKSDIEHNLMNEQINQYFQSKINAEMSENDAKQMSNTLSNNWIQYFIKLNPSIYLQKVKCPILALNGAKDVQVDGIVNLKAIENEVLKSGNKNVVVKLLPNLNHLFQECTRGLPSEYSTIDQTFAPSAMLEIKNWIFNLK